MTKSFVYENPKDFMYIKRFLNTNIDGKRRIAFALTAIKGVGLRLSHMICKVAKVDLSLRAGEIPEETWDKFQKILEDPLAFDIPKWYFNRQKDYRSGKDMHVVSNILESKIREDIERMKKIKMHRGVRHYWQLKVRGQHTKSTGRRGVTIGVVRKRIQK